MQLFGMVLQTALLFVQKWRIKSVFQMFAMLFGFLGKRAGAYLSELEVARC